MARRGARGYHGGMARSTRKQEPAEPPGRRVRNRRARFDYNILEKVECGIVLTGTEVKSLRAGSASLEGAFARDRFSTTPCASASCCCIAGSSGSWRCTSFRRGAR